MNKKYAEYWVKNIELLLSWRLGSLDLNHGRFRTPKSGFYFSLSLSKSYFYIFKRVRNIWYQRGLDRLNYKTTTGFFWKLCWCSTSQLGINTEKVWEILTAITSWPDKVTSSSESSDGGILLLAVDELKLQWIHFQENGPIAFFWREQKGFPWDG